MTSFLRRLWHEPVLLFTTIAGVASLLATQGTIGTVTAAIVGGICLFLARQSVTPNAKLVDALDLSGELPAPHEPSHDPDDPAQYDPVDHA